MSHFPAFFDLRGRTALVIGGTPLALARARFLLGAGATVRIFASELSDEGRRLIVEPGVAWFPGSPAAADIADAAFVFVASGDETQDRAVAAAAKSVRVPVNVADRAELSDFIMPAVVRRGDVTVGISTGGAAPALARALRATIEAALPARLGDLARFAGNIRQRIKALIPAPEARRRFWERLIDGPIGEAILAGRSAAAHQRLLVLLNGRGAESPASGVVHIVGAGPGDPDLLTLRALRVMQQADIVFYDELIGPSLLDSVRRDAERVYVGKQKGRHSKSQDVINDEMLSAARSGKRVVRLKGGDPFIFGRGGEELEFLRRHGIETQVVPGITAALGCAAIAGIPLTHRHYASSVTFLAGYGRDGLPPSDWHGLVRSGRTLVVYMGVSAAPVVAERLVAEGLPHRTPVAVIESGTRPEQRVSLGTLAELPALARRHVGGGPALIIVGEVAALADRGAAHASLVEAAA